MKLERQDMIVLIDTSTIMCQHPNLIQSCVQTVSEIIHNVEKGINKLCVILFSNTASIYLDWTSPKKVSSPSIEKGAVGMCNVHLGLKEVC